MLIDKSLFPTLMRRWGIHGHRYTRWAPAEALLKAAEGQGARLESELRILLKQSDHRFDPLCDPLHADAGLNRWLRPAREEVYSDWLEWILTQIKRPELILKVLKIGRPALIKAVRAQEMTVHREHVISGGRLDLVLHFGQQALIVIEVKTEPGEPTNTGKQIGYQTWIEQQKGYRCKHSVLLAVDFGGDEDYHGFTPLYWADFCIELRSLLPGIQRRLGNVKAAMMIAFVGAVETNLLRLVSPEKGNTVRHLFYSSTRLYLQKSLRRSHAKNETRK